MVTETDEVGGALDRVRAVDPDGKVNLAELVVLGADAKVEQLVRHREDEARRAALRESFLDRRGYRLGRPDRRARARLGPQLG